MIDCQGFLQQLDALAADGPEPPLSDEMREHLSGCESCSAEFHTMQEVWLLLPASLASNTLNSDVESRLMDRIRCDSRDSDGLSASTGTTSNLPVGFWRYALAASILATLVALPVMWSRVSDSAAGDPGDLATVEQFAREMEKIDELEQTFGAPALRYVSLKSDDPESKVRGYIVYDLQGKQGHFFGFELATEANRHYVLWLLDVDGQVAASATIEVTDKHLGSVIIDLPEDVSQLKSAAVTVETNAEVRYPSQSIVIRSNIEL